MHSITKNHQLGSRAATPATRAANRLRVAIDWLRAGYSETAPQEGHCALIALTGPTSLSSRDIDRFFR